MKKHVPSYTAIIYATISFLLLSLISCEKEEESLVSVPTVRVLFSVSGLGDMSYSDNILRGILQAQQESYFHLEYITPKDKTEAEQIIRQWQTNNDPKYYFNIIADSNFEDIIRKLMPAEEAPNYLFFDTRSKDFTIPVFHTTGYGVSFLAGVAAYSQVNAETAAYMGGYTGESYIEECFDGFRDGYIYAGGKQVVRADVSNTAEGFSMSQRAYNMADSLYELYPFIYAMAGSSNNGIYQYLREHPQKTAYTAGVDTDQSALSNKIIGSMIKDLGLCVKYYITLWLNGESLPMRECYTLDSGFLSFKIADLYKDKLEQIVANHLQTAKQKETEYEQNKETH